MAVALTAAIGGCGSGAASSSTARSGHPAVVTRHRKLRPRRPPAPLYPRVLPAAAGTPGTGFTPAATWRGHTAAWVARRAGVALLAFDQHLVGLRLHSGTLDAGSAGWLYGPHVAGRERAWLVAAFNGGFKLSTNSGGFVLGGRTAVPLTAGLGSIVTYRNGVTDIGAWHEGVPAPGRRILSVRQNLHLLVSGGGAASDLSCLLCWGATLGGTPTPARSGLGITGDGRLIWAGGESLSPAALAAALIGAGVQRAVELDINPEWVAAYIYGHHHGHGPLAPVPIVPGQPGVAGQFLAPYSRDFFTVVGR